jgi:hypothetical protein
MSRLPVRITYEGSTYVLTDAASDLEHRRSAPGGFTSLDVTLDLPRTMFPNLGPDCRVEVFDPRTGRTLWEGWAERPGQENTRAGQRWKLAAVGNRALASDQRKPMIYIDRELAWSEASTETMPQSARAEVTSNPRGGGGEGLFTGLPKGTTAFLALQSQIGYTRCREAGIKVGALGVTITAGRNDNDYLSQMTWSDGVETGSGVMQSGTGIFTSSDRRARFVGSGGVHPPEGIDVIALRLIRTTSGGSGADIPDNTHWLWHTDPVVVGQRMDRHGTPLTGGTGLVTTEYVQADWVVADVIARYLPLVDPTLARIETPTNNGEGPWFIDQLAYVEATTADEIVSELERWEPAMTWELLETVEGRGVRYNYRHIDLPPDTHPGSGHRYELSMTADSVELPGPDTTLCNRIVVAWTDTRGNDRTTTVTSTVPALVNSRRVHDADPITLPPGIGSESNAQRAGLLALAALNEATLAGSAVVSRRLYDRLTGLTVEPYEIEAGYSVLVAEEGTTVRLTNTVWDDEAGLMRLTLGSPRLTVDQRVARLASRARNPRRRAA